MAIILSASDPNQVASATSFEALVGEPAERLLVMSGIAIPEFWTNHDEEPRADEIIVRLGVHVASLDDSTVHVGLCGISNDETNFTFSLNTAVLKVEPGTGELLLSVGAVILGEKTLIHRFGYQVVAKVRKVAARIEGVIAVPVDILDVSRLSPAELAVQFKITASRIERQAPPPGGFAWDRLIPVKFGKVDDTASAREGVSFVAYTIDGCPFFTPLQVDVEPVGRLATLGVGVAQVAGPRPVTLTNLAPDASGVDFAVARFAPVR